MSGIRGMWRRPLLWDLTSPPHLALAGLVLRWVHSGGRWRTRIVYGLIIWQFVGLFVLAVAGPVIADPTPPTTPAAPSAPAEPAKPNLADTSMFSWTQVKDSSGIPISSYFIAVDQGNAFSVIPGVGGDKKANIALAPILELEYGLIKITCQLALWIIGYGLSFKWLDFIAKPFTKLGQATEVLPHNIGILSLTLALAGGVAAFAALRGHLSKAGYQIGSAMVITALMAGLFAHPVAALVGPDGYLAKARDVGFSISTGITRGSSASPTSSGSELTQLQTDLADGFLRRPTQMLNFNAQADTNGCKGVWDSGIRSGDRDKLKDSIAKCGSSGKQMKYAADHLTGDRLASAAFIWLLALILLAFGCYLMGKILLTVVIALTNAIMLPIVGSLGVVAGAMQGMAFKCLCNIGLALIKLPLTVIYAGSYAALLGSLLDASDKSNPIQTLFLAAILLVIALLAFRRINRGLKNSGGNVLNFLNRGGGNTNAATTQLPGAGTGSKMLRRGAALALQAGGAALGVPPTVTGLVVGGAGALRRRTSSSAQRANQLPADAASQAELVDRHQDQYERYQNQYEWYEQRQPRPQLATSPDAEVQVTPTTMRLGSTTVRGPAVTEVIREAPPLHPHVASAVSAMPHQMRSAPALPAGSFHRSSKPVSSHPRPSRPMRQAAQPARAAASTPRAVMSDASARSNRSSKPVAGGHSPAPQSSPARSRVLELLNSSGTELK